MLSLFGVSGEGEEPSIIIGTTVSAGLPNITGGGGHNTWGSSKWTANYNTGNGWGCFDGSKTQTNNYGGSGGSSGQYMFQINASWSNAIYGSSSTVTPESLRTQFFIKF